MIRSSSQDEEALEKQGSSEEEPVVMQSCSDQNKAVVMQRCGEEARECPRLDCQGQKKKERPNRKTASSGEMRPDAPECIIWGGASSRRRRPLDLTIQGQVAACRRGLDHLPLNASPRRSRSRPAAQRRAGLSRYSRLNVSAGS